MRDPDRIRPFLEEIAGFWEQHPDWRFGQLVMNLSRSKDGFADIWEWDTVDFRFRMERYKRREKLGI